MQNQEMTEAIKRWKATGYGVDPNQLVFRHYPGDGCECMSCQPGLHPAVETFTDGSIEHFPTKYSQVESWAKSAKRSTT